MSTEYGTGRGLQLKNDMPAAGKTGTSNGSKDTWFCGYTKYYSMAVWVGHDMPVEMPGIYGATYAGKIWKNVMDSLHEGLTPEDWDVPETVVKETDEFSQITDYVSLKVKRKGEDYLRKNVEKDNKEAVISKLESYENMEIDSVEDIFKARALFSEIRELIDDIDDEQFKTAYLERLFTKQKEFLKIEDEREDEINAYLKEKEESAHSKEESKEESGKNAKREAFLSSLSTLQSLEYRDGDTETLISEAIARLKDLEGASDSASLKQQLEKAINRVRKLPLRNSGSSAAEGPGNNLSGPGDDIEESESENGPGIIP